MKSSLELGKVMLDFSYEDRFRFFSCQNLFSPISYLNLQQDFDKLDWKQKTTDFYRQYECVIQPSSNTCFTALFEPSFFFPFKKMLQDILKTDLRDDIRLIAHKLITSDEIEVHNDYCDPDCGYENYRFIFQFARPGQLISGGELCFLASEKKEDLIKSYSYQANTGICFEITPHSYHYVSPIQGERHTLVMYIWDANKCYDGSGIRIGSDG